MRASSRSTRRAAKAVPGRARGADRRRHRLRAASAAACSTGRCWRSTAFGWSAIASPPSPPRRKAAADEAARLVEVEYEDLPLVTLDNALDDDAPVLHPDIDTYKFLGPKRPQTPHPNVHGHALVQKSETGEPSRTSSPDAPTTSSSTRSRPRASSRDSSSRAPASSGSTSRTACASSTPTSRRRRSASSWRQRWACRQTQIVVDTTFIGGDFGGKGLSIDEFACYFLARATGRPIKAVMSYVDEMQASNSRHPAIMKLRTAVDRTAGSWPISRR